jgi:hypothetical protein
MTNSELITKLNNLQSVNPDKKWLESNRELLLSQVSNSGAETLSTWKVVLINVSSVLKSAVQPAYALGAFVLLLLTGSFFSGQILASTKPNDSLYIARIISEKVKLNTTFSSAERNKMEARFASNHAQDISAVLSDPAFNNEENQDQVARLSDSFNEEVNTVKNRINSLNVSATPADGGEVVIADSAKDNKGIQVSEGSNLNITAATSAMPTISKSAVLVVPEELTLGTSSEAAATSTEAGEINIPATAADKILNEAQALFNSKDYEKASDKLKEVDEIIK